MKNLICGLLLFIGAHSISSAHGSYFENKGLPESGVWIGSLGSQQIMVCFERPEQTSIPNRSSYFYLKYSKPISLRQKEGKHDVWEEVSADVVTGVWHIQQVSERVLEANWKAPNSEKMLAINLRRFEDLSGVQDGCLSESGVHNPFKNKKISKAKINRGSIQQLSDKKYRTINIEKMNTSSLELLEEIPGRDAINFLLQNQLQSDAASYLSCRNPNDDEESENIDRSNYDSNARTNPVFWNEHWISFEHRSYGDCGGAYPYSGFSYTTFDTQSGQKVNLWNWIKTNRNEKSDAKFNAHYVSYAAPRNLNALIVKKAVKARRAMNGKGGDKESCLAELEGNSTYQLHLSKNGMVFSQDFPHVSQACNDEIELSFKELSPYLSEQGREAVQTLTH